MKESTLATKVMIGVLCVGVLLYLALYFILGFRKEVATTIAYHYTVDVGTEASAILVREETVLSDTGDYVDYVLSDGEKASANSAVALIYSDPSALDTRQEIRAVETEIRQLEYALSVGTQPVDSAKLDQQVVGSIVTLRALAAGGDLSALDDSVLNLRTMVFQRDYAYGDINAAEQIQTLIREKEDLLTTLQKSLSQVSKTVRTPASGVFAGKADGYEALITPDMLSALTMSGLDGLLNQDAPDAPDAVGKIITDSTWYLAALFDGGNTLSLTQGKTYTISFSHDYYGDVEMKLERVETNGDQTMAVFSSRTNLADVALLRIQAVNIIAEELTGIRVPRKALRVETKTITQEDGSTSQVNTYGVYTIVGTQAEWQEVNVLHTGDTYYLVEPVDEADSGRLRAGDTVILSSSGLYDGKVVR